MDSSSALSRSSSSARELRCICLVWDTSGEKEAMQAICCGRNFARPSTGVAALSEEHADKTAHEIRFGESFPGHCVPFGNASIPRLATRLQSSKKILGDTYLWFTIYIQVDVGDYLVLDTATYAKNPDGDLCHAHR
eukprot:4118221-Pyramimonas_sp.AAC.1